MGAGEDEMPVVVSGRAIPTTSGITVTLSCAIAAPVQNTVAEPAPR
jgi:hypothetical protein